MVLELEAGTAPRLYYGDYAYYLEKKAALAAAAAFPQPYAGAAGQPSTSFASQTSSASSVATLQPPATWGDEKARKARYRKLKKMEEELLARLEAVSAEKKEFENAMALPINYSDGAKVKKNPRLDCQPRSRGGSIERGMDGNRRRVVGVGMS